MRTARRIRKAQHRSEPCGAVRRLIPAILRTRHGRGRKAPEAGPEDRQGPAEAAPAAAAPARARRSCSAAAAFTGGVYEIGALRALDLLAVNRTVNEFDVYVGTSAGSFLAALTANGVTPEEMMRVVNQQVPTPFADVDRDTLMRPNALRVRHRARRCCRCACSAWGATA